MLLSLIVLVTSLINQPLVTLVTYLFVVILVIYMIYN